MTTTLTPTAGSVGTASVKVTVTLALPAATVRPVTVPPVTTQAAEGQVTGALTTVRASPSSSSWSESGRWVRVPPPGTPGPMSAVTLGVRFRSSVSSLLSGVAGEASTTRRLPGSSITAVAVMVTASAVCSGMVIVTCRVPGPAAVATGTGSVAETRHRTVGATVTVQPAGVPMPVAGLGVRSMKAVPARTVSSVERFWKVKVRGSFTGWVAEGLVPAPGTSGRFTIGSPGTGARPMSMPGARPVTVSEAVVTEQPGGVGGPGGVGHSGVAKDPLTGLIVAEKAAWLAVNEPWGTR